MSIFLSILRLLLLVISFYGYLQWVSRTIRPEFSIGIVFCGIGSLMFLAGILNILEVTAAVILLTGLVLTFCSLRRKDSIRKLICTGTVFFVLSCVFFFFLLHDSIFIHYDNFSHWGISTKVLMQENRFPNFQNVNIMFKSYPLGFASFIYYICACIGVRTEWMQMFAQAILMAGIASSLFAFARTVPQKLLIAAGIIMLLAGNTNFVDLLVDTLLPVIAIGGIAFCLYYRDSIWDKWMWLIPYTAMLVSVKNSGMFFAAVILVYLLTKVRSKHQLKLWAWSALSPLMTLLLWQRHVDLVYDKGMMSYHSMSLDYFDKILGEKSAEDVVAICHSFCGYFFSPDNEILFILPLLAIVFVLFLFGKRKTQGTEVAALTLLTYVSYVVMLLAMYMLTMPLGESLETAGYVRYHDTIIIFLSGILLIAGAMGLDGLSGRGILRQLIPALLCGTVLYAALTPHLEYYKKQDPLGSFRGVYRHDYANLIEEYNLPQKGKYLIVVDPEFKQQGFLRYLTRYTLDPAKFSVEYVDLLIEDPAILDKYDYLVAFTYGDTVQAYMEYILNADPGQRVISLKDID